MARAGFIRRHKAAVASNTALVLAAGAVVAYAVAADGYQAHEAQLNDGGIWVVHGDRGIYGRINKPINQLDTTVLGDGGSDRPLDVAQDGAAVAAIDRLAGTAQVIDPATSKLDASGKIAIPPVGDQQMAGGTFASIDAENGDVWAVQLDPQRGRPLITALDVQSDPLASVGNAAALAVSQTGTVIVTSAGRGTITYIVQEGNAFDEPRTDDLPAGAGDPTAVTAVGETAITLDVAAGALSVVGGGSATVPPGSILQQPGPDAESVLVASPDSMLSVDLESGNTTVVDERGNGTPIEPVRLGACSYAAWSGGLGEVTVQCGDDEAQHSTLGGKASNLAFRVNRGQIVLNDNTSGAVWDLDEQEPQKIDNWNAFTMSKLVKDEDKQNQQQSAGDRTPPEAKPDSYGARSGRTTVLHPLDNDSAPEGRLLSIIDVEQPTGDATAEISPDGQTIVLRLPDKARDTSFDYYIDDGRSNFTAHAAVSVAVRTAGQNAQPTLRNGFEPRTWRVAANGSVTVPVLSDWRDDGDGDALVLDSTVALGAGDSGAVARTTSDGRVRFTGSIEGGDTYQVEYLVSDGRSAPVRQTMSFEVQERLDRETFPAVAEPDVVRGEAGRPIKIRPLLNDLPGSDPGTPNAELMLGGKIPAQNGVSIKTDVENGIITFAAERPDTYFIEYDAAFGNARLDQQTVRIDVRPRPKSPGDPVAMPDTLTVYGQAAGIVDVLANDLDPAGGLLVVQRAVADNPNQVDVAIIDGRWLRISSRQGDLSPNPQLVHYTISNGSTSGIEGEVSLSQRHPPADNSPVTTTDRVHVRAGTSVTVPVLDNDISPSGDRLSLISDAAEGVPGELPIDVPVDVKGDVGTALVSGRNVRYIAPDLKERDSFEVGYIARSTTGESSGGRLIVIITPAKDPNTAPEPPTLEGRVVSGGSIKVRLPGSGIDPEGDPVTVGGITSAPRLGRVLSYGGNFLEYQAYPRTTGTDEFEYSLTDSRGAVGTGTVRVAVVPLGEPQPPLAVADQLTVEPGRVAVFDPLANDYIAPGDEVEISLRDAPEGVTLDPDTNLVSVPAPATTQGASPPVVYAITNGISTSISTLKVDTADDFENPPVVYDAFGQADDSGSISVNVLEGAYDPDGTIADLTVTRVYGNEAQTTINATGDTIKANRGPLPIVVPFRVEDGNGAAATASLYVPPTGTGIPYVRPDALIELAEGGSATGRLKDYIVNPSGGPLRLTGRESVSASPAALETERSGDDSFAVSARDGFRGPGALLVEVTTAANGAGNEDPQDPTDGYTALLSIPVQVGDDTPVLECPQTTIPISAGEVYNLDIASLCKVWTLDPADAPGLEYVGIFTQELDGLSVSGNGSPVLQVAAADDANRGGEGTLSITAGGSLPAEIRFRLANAPPPSMLPIRVEGMKAGESRELNLAPYLDAGVANPTPTVVSIDAVSGAGVSAGTSGQASVILRAGPRAKGRAIFRVVMSDVDASSAGPGRQAEGRIEFDVSGLPGQPGAPQSYENVEKGTVRLGWFAPKDDGGSPITSYRLKEMQTGDEITCRTNQCDFPGLENRKKYNFRVAAVNKVGTGPWSELSQTAYADTKPGRVANIRMISRGDHTITLGWSKPQSSTAIQFYRISWRGQAVQIPGNTTSYTVSNLDNNQTYLFSIEAQNSVNWSPPRQSAPLQSIGTPAPPGGLAIVDRQSGLQATDVTATWTATAPEGPAPTFYTLAYSAKGGPLTAVPGCSRIQATTCTHTGVAFDGTTYAYYVQALNIENSSPPGSPVAFEAVGKPAPWGQITAAPTGADGQARVTGITPESRGQESRVAILVAGQVAWELVVKPRAIINEVVNVPGNSTAYPVTMRLCNEFAAKVGCSYSDPKSVQTYGPLENHLNPVTSQVDGLSVTWTISGTSNGDPALVAISIDGGAEQVVGQGTPGEFSLTRTVTVADYNTGTSIRVRLFDDNPAGRREAVVTGQVESGDPPPPTMTLFKGAACSDDGVADPPDCQRGVPYVTDPACGAPTCARLSFTTSGWTQDFSCRVSQSTTPFVGERQDFTKEDGTKTTTWYFGEGYVELTCNSSKQQVIAGISW
ncbi:fibronectin type III domain-containing protein [Nocardioides sp.]|uniref:fibronectin type III domain-containing protein n=1 Tax=Nocardioides sp. TaxID=35761 RepID=UPI00286DFDA4|nr:fibronectin type III domain-containing protein [Nocardioides sp.]